MVTLLIFEEGEAVPKSWERPVPDHVGYWTLRARIDPAVNLRMAIREGESGRAIVIGSWQVDPRCYPKRGWCKKVAVVDAVRMFIHGYPYLRGAADVGVLEALSELDGPGVRCVALSRLG